jgi:hypothetical protein
MDNVRRNIGCVYISQAEMTNVDTFTSYLIHEQGTIKCMGFGHGWKLTSTGSPGTLHYSYYSTICYRNPCSSLEPRYRLKYVSLAVKCGKHHMTHLCETRYEQHATARHYTTFIFLLTPSISDKKLEMRGLQVVTRKKKIYSFYKCSYFKKMENNRRSTTQNILVF